MKKMGHVPGYYYDDDDNNGTAGQAAAEAARKAADEAMQKARLEADTAKATAAKLAKQLDELKAQVPTEEQKKKWAELDKQFADAEEERKRKAGEFDSWRTAVQEKHQKELEAKAAEIETAQQKATLSERILNDTLIGNAFANASKLFGPSAKTVMIPQMAQAFFAKNVEVDVSENSSGQIQRRVVVKDDNGSTLIDAKTGRPMEFERAMEELIDTHPQKDALLRGSGKVGSGSSGAAGSNTGEFDPTKIKASDFKDPAFREKFKQHQRGTTGMKIGPGWDLLQPRSK